MTNALIHIFIRDAENTGDSRVREKFGVLSGAVGLACNLFLFALKLIIGLLTGSISIAADAFNNLSDGLSCLISIVGFKVSGKEPDAKHPFGYGRTEYIAGLIVSFIIILVGFEFFKTSLDRILHPAAVAFSAVLMGILAVSMLVKLWMGAFNVNIGRRIDSPVLMAAGQDSRNDVVTTAVVVLGMVASRFTTLPVDGYVGVAVAAFILWSGIGIAKEEQGRIFERFYRVDASRSAENGGTGLGLSIVKHGAALHNGKIFIESEIGNGTSIEISLPYSIN